MSNAISMEWLEVDGNVICQFGGEKGVRNITVPKEDIPIPAWKIAALLNAAYKYGAQNKAAEFRRILEIGEH